MIVLGIESSCDETSIGIVEDGRIMLSNVIRSQIDIHKKYGGVVPEVAARNHIEVIIAAIEESLKISNQDWDKIDAIAVTNGPGLFGSLMVGVMTAKTLAWLKNKPLYPTHHVLGHIYANWLGENIPELPALALIVSGGHTHLYWLKNHGEVTVLGRTTDDAVGEAFDKVAKMIGLPYPGGPSIANASINGDPNFLKLPIPKTEGKYDFSFSGLKTAVLRDTQKIIGEDHSFNSTLIPARLSQEQRNNIAASFQSHAVDVLVRKVKQAFKELNPKSVIIGGGVASNSLLRKKLSEKLNIDIEYAVPSLCTDNGAMIAAAAYWQIKAGKKPKNLKDISVDPNLKIV
jgi:N6-L-threonylcarbamoyladenine synthase